MNKSIETITVTLTNNLEVKTDVTSRAVKVDHTSIGVRMWATVDDLIWTDNTLDKFSVTRGSTILSDYVVKCRYSFLAETGCEHVDVDDTMYIMMRMMRNNIGDRITELQKARQVMEQECIERKQRV